MREKKVVEKLFGEYLEELGICTSEQVEQALDYCADCSKTGRFIPIGQALVELGFTTVRDIDRVLQLQTRDRSTAYSESTDRMMVTPAGDNHLQEQGLEQEEMQLEEQPEMHAEDQARAEVGEEVEEPDIFASEQAEQDEMQLEEQPEVHTEDQAKAEVGEEAEEADIFTSEQAERLGIFSSEQVEKALGYCTACSKRQRFVSLGQALVELGYATRDWIDTILRIRPDERTLACSKSITKIMGIPAGSEQARELGEQVEELGLCTPDRVEEALGYWEDCSKRQRYISIGQALVELGCTTQDKIDDVLKKHAKIKASAYTKGMVKIMEIPLEAKQARELGKQVKELGICTSEQVEQALGYWEDCSKWGRSIPIGQALVELGHATMHDIDEILQMQAGDRAHASGRGLTSTE